MIPGIEPNSATARLVKKWAEENIVDIQGVINTKDTSHDETQYQRGRRDFAQALLDGLKPEEIEPPSPRRPRDRSGHR